MTLERRNPKRPSSDEFALKNDKLKGNLLAFASWFSLSFHEQTPESFDEDFEDSVIQTLALANMAMVEALSLHYGRRIDIHTLLDPLIAQTLRHEEQQQNCPHRGNKNHDCGGHQ